MTGPSLSDQGAIAACLAELLAKYRPMAPKYSYPVTNTALANDGLALINLADEMIAYFSGAGGGGSGNPLPTSVSVLPTLPALTSLGATLQMTAVVLDQNQNVLTPGVGGIPALVWASSNTTAATVNSTGLVTETGNGQTIISATCGAHGGGTTVTCSGAATLVPTTVTISPSSASLTSQGATQQFTAVVKDQNGNPMTPGSGGIPALVWSSLNTAVATVNSATGLATEVGNGTASIKCVCGSASNTATLTCSGVVTTGTPTTVTVSPVSASLTSLGSTQSYTAVVLDQNRNVMTPGSNGCPALVWNSSNGGSATINSATGVATETGNGTTTISAKCGSAVGNATLTTSGAPNVGSSAGPNYPGGMTVVMDTGPLFPTSAISSSGASYTSGGNVPTTITNDGPSTKSSTGDWAGNLLPCPSSGIRFVYDPTLQGGNSPVVALFSNFANQGTGEYYMCRKIRLSSNWTFSAATGIKTGEPHTSNASNNHVFSLNATGTNGNQNPTGFAYSEFIIQINGSPNYGANVPGGQGGASGNGLPPTYAAMPQIYSNQTITNVADSVNLGNWCLEEWLIVPESPVGNQNTGGQNGQLTIWVNGNLAWTSVGKNDGTPGQTGINYNSTSTQGLKIDPTYGGDQPTDHPPAIQYMDQDQFFFAVR